MIASDAARAAREITELAQRSKLDKHGQLENRFVIQPVTIETLKGTVSDSRISYSRIGCLISACVSACVHMPGATRVRVKEL